MSFYTEKTGVHREETSRLWACCRLRLGIPETHKVHKGAIGINSKHTAPNAFVTNRACSITGDFHHSFPGLHSLFLNLQMLSQRSNSKMISIVQQHLDAKVYAPKSCQ